jgi:DNA-binding response OmpR family regulator
MPVILLVGEDDILLRTRAAVLNTTAAETIASNSASALAIVNSRPCDLLLLCHSVPEHLAAGLIAAFSSRWPTTPILRMTSLRTWDPPSTDGPVERVPSADPARLVKRTAELLRAVA